MQLTFLFISFLFLFIFFETIQLIRRNYNRKNGYKKALFMSKQTKKPLLVIGSPETGGYNSIFGNNYGCGSICIDIVGCGKCKNQEQVDALEYLKKKPTNYYVIYESCVLEAIDDESKNKKIIDEINDDKDKFNLLLELIYKYKKKELKELTQSPFVIKRDIKS